MGKIQELANVCVQYAVSSDTDTVMRRDYAKSASKLLGALKATNGRTSVKEVLVTVSERLDSSVTAKKLVTILEWLGSLVEVESPWLDIFQHYIGELKSKPLD